MQGGPRAEDLAAGSGPEEMRDLAAGSVKEDLKEGNICNDFLRGE